MALTPIRWKLLLAVLGLLQQTAFALEDGSLSFSAGTIAFEAGEYAEALDHFEAARNAGVSGPAVHYNIASCYFRLNRFEDAEQEFRLIAEKFPLMRSLAEYNTGLALLEQGKQTEARLLFESVRRNSDDQKLRSLARRAILAIEPADRDAGRRHWFGLVDVNVGHDDNVALIDDLATSGGQTDSGFTETLAVVSGPDSTGDGLRFDGSFYLIRYHDAAAFDQTVVQISPSYRKGWSEWTAQAGPRLSFSTLDGDSFERRLGAGLKLVRRLGRSSFLTLHTIHEATKGGSPAFDFLDGSVTQVGVDWDRVTVSARVTLGVWLEQNDRFDPGVSPSRHRFSARYRRLIGDRWSTDARVVHRSSRYDGLQQPRAEDRIELGFEMTRRLSEDWRFATGYAWQRNNADVAVYDYRRTRLTFGLSKDF